MDKVFHVIFCGMFKFCSTGSCGIINVVFMLACLNLAKFVDL